jgi:ribonuclease J
VLLTEGTNLGSDKPTKLEDEIEGDFVELFAKTKGRVFVSWSGQNIDRTVTLYRAAKRTGRTLAIDLYTADVLDRIAQGTGVPHPGFENLEVVVTRGLGNHYRRLGREDFIERMVPHGISAKRLIGGRHVIMLRRALMADYQRAGAAPTADDAFNFSMWRGYLCRSLSCGAVGVVQVGRRGDRLHPHQRARFAGRFTRLCRRYQTKDRRSCSRSKMG